MEKETRYGSVYYIGNEENCRYVGLAGTIYEAIKLCEKYVEENFKNVEVVSGRFKFPDISDTEEDIWIKVRNIYTQKEFNIYFTYSILEDKNEY